MPDDQEIAMPGSTVNLVSQARPSELDALCREFDTQILPIIKRLKLFAQNVERQDLYRSSFVGGGKAFMTRYKFSLPAKSSRSVIDLAKLRVHFVATALAITEDAWRTGNGGDWEQRCTQARRVLANLQGYLEAMRDARADTSAFGAKGRRKLGDETKERVHVAAEDLRHSLSKERAAIVIAEQVNKSTSTVRRMLIEMYPGKAWRAGDG